MKTAAMLFAAICVASPAYADDSLADAAKTHYEHGQSLYGAGRFAEARAEFLAGYELSKKPAFLFNAAECARLLGDTQVARDGYNRYLALEPNGRLAMLAMQRLDELGPAKAPEVPPPPPILPAPSPTTTPMPSTPRVAPTTTTTTTVVRSTTPDDDSDTAHLERIAGIGLASTGAALVLTGAIFGYHSSSLSNQVSGACASGCIWSDVAGNDASARTDATVQWWLYGAGAAAILGGGALYLLGVHEQAPIAIAPTANGAAVSWSGRF
ncbi:MAG TPA: hypothetical protein VGG28_06380 [Kofleriaceae bacterium]|jgi:hypothetical protein